ncbi:hypothetical protein GE21DRAFT_1219231 [Neurospora crassa]|nr:hypothetical protein B23L21.260 [imported] - Neurospora crassa [Neurospora crassa]KHE80080.1 hypothetical protein GE21DRAFT_1219231 [Neurospora crassa]
MKSRIENLNDTTDNDKLVECEEKGQEEQCKIAGDGASFGKQQALPDWEEWCVFCLPARSSACFLQRRHGRTAPGPQGTGLDWAFKLYVWFVIGHLGREYSSVRRAGQRAGLKPGLKPALTVPELGRQEKVRGRPGTYLITDVERLKGWVHSF